MKTLYLIGGPMGVGKTAAGQALKRLLPRSVFLDGDWCWDANPFTVTEETRAMVMDNIACLLGSFLRCSAYDHVIFVWVMHRQDIMNELLSRLDTADCRVKRISLLCDAPTLCTRLQGDVDAGLRQAEVIARSLDYLPLYDALDTEKIDTTGLSPEEAARRIGGIP